MEYKELYQRIEKLESEIKNLKSLIVIGSSKKKAVSLRGIAKTKLDKKK